VTTPIVPEPDVKDWTWVIQEHCAECGFDAPAVERADVPQLVRTFAAVLAHAVRAPRATTRPQPDTWSPVEYACHTRDASRVFGERLRMMLAEDDPVFANWDQDETALEQRYWDQQPAPVGGELTGAAAEIADGFAGVRGEQWERRGTRSNGSVFTVDTFARYFLHDLAHHAWDVTGKRW
jgi:hypothetical protein